MTNCYSNENCQLIWYVKKQALYFAVYGVSDMISIEKEEIMNSVTR